MMVLLSTVAVSQQFSGIELVLSVLKLIFFLTIWFVSGIFFIPTLLKKAKHLLTDEMMLIISLALCLMMVILASNVVLSCPRCIYNGVYHCRNYASRTY
jgi:CPA2 family monovalent cation:H+ antiporter-2